MDHIKFVIELFKKTYPERSSDIDDMLDLLWFYGSSMELLMYTHVIWPEFVLIEDTVVLSYTVTGEEERRDITNMIKNQQWPINDGVVPYTCIELNASFFHNENKEIDDEDDEKVYARLTSVIHECWSIKLVKDFPNRKFSVHKSSDEEQKNGDFFVWFYEIKRT